MLWASRSLNISVTTFFGYNPGSLLPPMAKHVFLKYQRPGAMRNFQLNLQLLSSIAIRTTRSVNTRESKIAYKLGNNIIKIIRAQGTTKAYLYYNTQLCIPEQS